MGKLLGVVCLLVFLLLFPVYLPANAYYPGFTNFGVKPGAGKFLVASREMRFTRFRETVIFLTRHDQQGTVGVVVNRPSVFFTAYRSVDISLLGWEKHLFAGGPVQPDLYSILAEPRTLPGHEKNAVKNLVFIPGTQNVIRYTRYLKSRSQYRIYAGYAGWFPGQLMKEIRQGAWHVIPGDSRLIFDRQPFFVWRRLIERILLE